MALGARGADRFLWVVVAVAVLPTRLVLDRDGRVVWTHVGVLNSSGEHALREVLDSALAGTVARSGG